MGYEVYLKSPDGDVLTPDVPGSITFNVAPMLLDALGFPFGDLNGKSAGAYRVAIDRAVARMRRTPDKYHEMAPRNGCGTYRSTLNHLLDLRRVAGEHPEAIIVVSI